MAVQVVVRADVLQLDDRAAGHLRGSGIP